MPLMRFKNKRTGQEVLLDWSGTAPPTAVDIDHAASLDQTPPGVGIADQLAKRNARPLPSQGDLGLANASGPAGRAEITGGQSAALTGLDALNWTFAKDAPYVGAAAHAVIDPINRKATQWTEEYGHPSVTSDSSAAGRLAKGMIGTYAQHATASVPTTPGAIALSLLPFLHGGGKAPSGPVVETTSQTGDLPLYARGPGGAPTKAYATPGAIGPTPPEPSAPRPSAFPQAPIPPGTPPPPGATGLYGQPMTPQEWQDAIAAANKNRPQPTSRGPAIPQNFGGPAVGGGAAKSAAAASKEDANAFKKAVDLLREKEKAHAAAMSQVSAERVAAEKAYQQHLASVAKAQADTTAATEIANTKATLEPKPPVVKRTVKAGPDTKTTTWAAAAEPAGTTPSTTDTAANGMKPSKQQPAAPLAPGVYRNYTEAIEAASAQGADGVAITKDGYVVVPKGAKPPKGSTSTGNPVPPVTPAAAAPPKVTPKSAKFAESQSDPLDEVLAQLHPDESIPKINPEGHGTLPAQPVTIIADPTTPKGGPPPPAPPAPGKRPDVTIIADPTKPKVTPSPLAPTPLDRLRQVMREMQGPPPAETPAAAAPATPRPDISKWDSTQVEGLIKKLESSGLSASKSGVTLDDLRARLAETAAEMAKPSGVVSRGERTAAAAAPLTPAESPADRARAIQEEIDKLFAAKGTSETPPPVDVAPPETPAAAAGPSKPPAPPPSTMMTSENLPKRADEALRGNPRVQAKTPQERRAIYTEVGGADASRNWVKDPATGEWKWQPPSGEKGAINPGLLSLLGRTTAGAAAGGAVDREHPVRGAVTGGILASSAMPLLRAALEHPIPAARTATGAAIGSQVDPNHPVLGGVAGGLAGAAVPIGGSGIPLLKALDAARYEGALSGVPQLTNLIGNVGSLAFAPPLEMLRGNIDGGLRLAKSYMNLPQQGRNIVGGFKQGWNAIDQPLKFGEAVRPIGPAGRTLRAVDAATKRVLTQGGLTPGQAATYTYSGDPVSKIGVGAAHIQSSLPGRLITPFARTAINLGELGLSASPVRYFDPKLRALLPATNPVSEAMLAAVGPAAFAAGVTGNSPSNPTQAAAYGPMAFPAGVGRAIYDYSRYGKNDEGDISRAVLSQIPFLGDIPRFAEIPSKTLQSVVSSPIPQALMMVGDRTVREPHSVEDAVKERIPQLREGLPARRDFFGQALQRNAIGQYPPPIYNRDPHAAQLADLGALRREQSPSLGAAPQNSALQQTAIDRMLATMTPQRAAAMKALIAAGTPMGNADLSPQQQSRLQELRGGQTQTMATSVLDSPEFQQLPPEAQRAVIKALITAAIQGGTLQFRGERLQGAANDASKP